MRPGGTSEEQGEKARMSYIVIQEIAKQFHKLTRMHRNAQKVSLRSRANLEARKAQSECDKSLWRFAANILDDDRPLTLPQPSVPRQQKASS